MAKGSRSQSETNDAPFQSHSTGRGVILNIISGDYNGGTRRKQRPRSGGSSSDSSDSGGAIVSNSRVTASGGATSKSKRKRKRVGAAERDRRRREQAMTAMQPVASRATVNSQTRTRPQAADYQVALNDIVRQLGGADFNLNRLIQVFGIVTRTICTGTYGNTHIRAWNDVVQNYLNAPANVFSDQEKRVIRKLII